MNPKILYILALLGLAAAPAFSEGEVRAWVDSAEVIENSEFFLWIWASGVSVQDPTMPRVDGLIISRSPRRRSDSFGFKNGATTKEIQHGYIVRATKLGAITIPPIAVTIGGKTLFTKEIVINVSETPQPQVRQTTPSSQGGLASQSSAAPRAPTWDDLVFITSKLDKTEYYLGERVTLTLDLWRIEHDGIEVSSYRGANIRYPSSEGFYAADMREGPRQFRRREDWLYEVTGYRQDLYPTHTGELTIGHYHWEGIARARTTRGLMHKDYSLDTPELEITIKPLPPRPPNFSGAVGEFQLRAELNDREFLQGIPTKLLLNLSGKGNPDALGEPRFPKIDQAYVAEPETKVRPANGVEGGVEKIFAYTIIPLEPGNITIPRIEYVYFNPNEGKFVTASVGPFTLDVLPSPEQEQRMIVAEGLDLEDQQVRLLAQDINPPTGHRGSLTRTNPSPITLPALAAAPVIGYSVLALVMVRRRRFENDVAYARSYHAKSKGQKQLRQVLDDPEPADALFRAVTGFIADIFNVAQAGLTSNEIEQLLCESLVDPRCADNLLKVLKACERSRYASTTLSDMEIKALLEGAMAEIDRLALHQKEKKKS